MICSLFAILWSSELANKQCSGICQSMTNLCENVDQLLKKNKCYDVNDSKKTLANLLLNRLTPHNLKQELMGSLDVCKTHLVSTITRAKSLHI